MIFTMMKWILPVVFGLGLTLIIIFAGLYLPLPGLSFFFPRNKTLLERPSVLRLKGKLYVVGGYNTKNVPVGYQLVQPANWYGSEVPDLGWDDEIKRVVSKQVFEVTDQEEAYIIEHTINRSPHATLFINPNTWKNIGTVNSWKTIRDSGYYQELNDRVYAVGGTGYNAEINEDVQYTDVWMSADGLKWSQVCQNVPWSKAGFNRRNHTITVSNGAMYLTGGFGTKPDGQDGQMDYRDIWKSEDGTHWQVATTLPHSVENQLLKIQDRYFYIKDADTLYVSADKSNWQKLFETGFSLGILNNKLAMVVPNDSNWVNGYDLYTSTNGTTWQHSKTGEPISWTRLEDNGDYNFTGFTLVEFNDELWLIGQGPNRIYRSKDGHQWTKVTPMEIKVFSPRTDAGVGVFNGYLWIMGGASNSGISLGDIWKSKDGRSWEKVTDHASWGLAESGDIVVAKGRLYFIKKGTRWHPDSGVIGTPIQIWSTTDGLHWQRESGQSGDVIISAYSEEDLGKIDRGIETKDTMYFFDGARYQLFFREHNRDIAQRTFGLRGLDFGTIAELRMKGQRPIFIIRRGHTIYSSFDLHQWGEYSLESREDENGERIDSGFLTNYDDDIKYKPFIFKNRLFMVGVDFRERKVYSAELVVDSEKEIIRQVPASHSSKATKQREQKMAEPETPDTHIPDNEEK
jgi:hypothetical protein